MQDFGFFRIAAGSAGVEPGNLDYCLEEVKKAIDWAEEKSVSLLVLPELCLTSASCGDLYLNSSFAEKAGNNILTVSEYTLGKSVIVCYSFPVMKDGALYSAAALAYDGGLLGIVPLDSKDRAQFTDYKEDDSTVFLGGKIVPFGSRLLFRSTANKNITISILNSRNSDTEAAIRIIPDSSLEIVGYSNLRHDFARIQSKLCHSVYVYSSSGEGESTAKGVYSGHTIIAESGEILAEIKPFENGFCLADADLESVAYQVRRSPCRASAARYTAINFEMENKALEELCRSYSVHPFFSDDEKELSNNCLTAFEIQSRGLAERLRKTGIRNAVLGVSGGLDSTLALLVSVRAMEILGRTAENVIAVSMPCFGTSSRTKSNAEQICSRLGVTFRLIDISNSVKSHLNDIGHDMTTADTAYENAQARERTQVLMDIANMDNALVVGTGDMSESALGWCTYNGDHMSMYNVNCSVTKTFIREIVRWYAERSEDRELSAVLMDIVDTPVSPELKPTVHGEISQKTEDIIGPYDLHDFFLYHFLRNGSGYQKILYLAKRTYGNIYDEHQIENWLQVFFRRFFSSQFKRNCVPEGPVVGDVNLSDDVWNMPSDVSGILFC